MSPIAIGDRYGKLVVIGPAGRDINKNRLWVCRCDCGNTRTLTVSALGEGKRRSCGCLRQEILKARRKKIVCTEELSRFLYSVGMK